MGTFTRLGGEKYEGMWDRGKVNGRGKMVFSNGDVYEGEWKYGERSGRGYFKNFGGVSYEGPWKNDHMDGVGVSRSPDGREASVVYERGRLVSQNLVGYPGNYKDVDPDNGDFDGLFKKKNTLLSKRS